MYIVPPSPYARTHTIHMPVMVKAGRVMGRITQPGILDRGIRKARRVPGCVRLSAEEGAAGSQGGERSRWGFLPIAPENFQPLLSHSPGYSSALTASTGTDTLLMGCGRHLIPGAETTGRADTERLHFSHTPLQSAKQ